MQYYSNKAKPGNKASQGHFLVKRSQRYSRSRLKTRLLRLCHLRNTNTVSWWRFVPCSPTRLLGLIIRLSWSHSFLIIQLDGGCTVSTGAQQQQFGGDHDSSDALMQLTSNVQVQKTKKIYLKYEKIWKKYGIFGHPGKELTTPRARIAAGSVFLICCRGTLIYVGLDHGQSCSIRTILFTQVEPIVYMNFRVEPLGWRDHKTPQQSNSWPFVKNKTIHSISLVEFWSEIVSLRSYVVICSSKNQIRISIYQ